MFGQLAPLKREAMRWLPSLKIICAFAKNHLCLCGVASTEGGLDFGCKHGTGLIQADRFSRGWGQACHGEGGCGN